MQYQIALDPELELSASEFVEAWNASEYAQDAPASLTDAPKETFLSPEVTLALITAAVSIPTTVITTFVSEYLKKKFLENKKSPEVTVTTISTSKGKPVWVIKQTKK